ncbi:MAG: acyl-CoA oxidase, partial [Gemmatimonadetes bacterium]|nr:acyl-CoA oxidase [Gemmatimonadota bacterium]
MPHLATAYALDFAVKRLVRRLVDHTDDDAREIEVLGAAYKAYTSRFAVDTLQCCREACGGQGYLSLNRIGPLRADADVFTTFEGANPVLLQLAAKGLLTEYRTQVGELGAWGMVRHLAGRASTALTELNPVVTRKSDEEHLRAPDFQLDALRYREERLLGTVARRLKSRIDDGLDSFVAMNECQDHLIALANAYVERLVLETFQQAVDDCADEALRAALTTLRDLFALAR